MGYNQKKICDVLNSIAGNKYLLPAIQRKFVWKAEQIETLFDSILRDYPINSFMFWKINDHKIKHDFVFYSFLFECGKDGEHDNNPVAPTSALTKEDLYAVIDGQQRLTSLYIGLCGCYREHEKYKPYEYNDTNYPKKYLYLDLSKPINSEIDNDKDYNFKFLSNQDLDEEKSNDHESIWFRVSDIMDESKFPSSSSINSYAMKNGFGSNDFAVQTLGNLFNKIKVFELISYYEITEQDLDKVLDIFIRTNSGGTPLSFSDLLMSVTSANWKSFNARDEIKDTIEQCNKYGNPNFNISKDLILKSILFLCDVDIKFKVKNFDKDNIELFENRWEGIKNALISTFNLLDGLGFNDSLLRAQNAIIPIANYIYKNGLNGEIEKKTKYKTDRDEIRKWLIKSLLKGIFGGQSDNVLSNIRNVMKSKGTPGFPGKAIEDKFKSSTKNYSFDSDFIDKLLESQYNSINAGLVLNLLYPGVVLSHGNNIAEDHMHPKSLFKEKYLKGLGYNQEKIDFFSDKKNFNSVLNLQLLEKTENESKSEMELKKWAKSKGKINADLYLSPATSLAFDDFENFIEDRRKVLKNKLESILS